MVHDAEKVLSEVYDSLSKTKEEKVIAVDGEISFADITQSFFDTIQKLAPFGMGNPKPLFLFKNVAPTEVSFFGKNNDHLLLVFSDDKRKMEVISFFVKGNTKLLQIVKDTKISFTGVIEKDTYKGGLRVRLVDILT